MTPDREAEMSGPTPNRPTARPPHGLVGMLALVAAVELAVAGHRLDFTTVWADDWRRTAEAATRHARGRDVLCFGDSLVKFGVLPRVIEARAGLKAYNLATNAGTMPSAYFLLRKTLGSGARPRVIVADFCALMLPDVPRVSVRMYPELATGRDCLDLASASRDAGFLAATLLGKVLPSYKCRHEVRASLMAAFEGRRASPWPAQAAIWATWKAQDGAQPMPPPPSKAPADPGLIAGLTPASWDCDPLNADYLERFLDLADAHAVPVVWLMPPLGPEIQAGRALQGTDAAYARFARRAMARHPTLTVLDARTSGYDGTVHIDPIHLDNRGAAVLSGDVASALLDRFEGRSAGRWVDLPPYAGRTGPAPPRAVARSGVEPGRR